jgi:hypothetical protein
MEWTIEHKDFMDMEFFLVSTPVSSEYSQAGTHTIMVEFVKDRGKQGWIARDACDRGEIRSSLIHALISYIDRSKQSNASGVGHCGWMIEVGLPALETAKFELASTMCSAYLSKHMGSVN